jgi:hypothetical protein
VDSSALAAGSEALAVYVPVLVAKLGHGMESSGLQADRVYAPHSPSGASVRAVLRACRFGWRNDRSSRAEDQQQDRQHYGEEHEATPKHDEKPELP